MLVLSTLDRDEMVPRFLDIYAAENRRPGRADRPMLYREQLETIRREAILAMVLRVENALPARLKVRVAVRTITQRKKGPKKKRKGAARSTRANCRRPTSNRVSASSSDCSCDASLRT